MLETARRPRHITRNSLALATRHTHAIQQDLDRLPLTAAVIVAAYEIREKFALRRVDYAKCVPMQSVSPLTMARLVKIAGMQRLEQVPVIRDALVRALDTLKMAREFRAQ